MVIYSGVQEPVTAAVWYALNNYCYTDAIFIAERLHAEVHSSDTTFLLATCYYRSGRLQQAKHLLSFSVSGSHHCHCVLLYAQCCLDLKEYKQGLVALNEVLSLPDLPESVSNAFGEDVGVAYLTLGKLKRHLKNKQDAAKCFRAALKHNPFLWSAYEMLCEMGEEVCPEECFTVSEYPKFLRLHPLTPPTSLQTSLFNLCGKPGTDPIKSKMTPSSTTTELMSEPDRIYAESAISDTNVSAFRPVATKDKPLLMTPDIYQDSSLGGALASSTPRNYLVRDKLSLTMGSFGVQQPKVVRGGMEVGLKSGRNVVGPLHFSGGLGSGKGYLQSLDSPTMTPLNPSFGTLSLSTPSPEEAESPLVKGVEKILSFSPATPPAAVTSNTDSSRSVTPPPTPLPPDYLKLIQSAPRVGVKMMIPSRPIAPSPLATSSSMDYSHLFGQQPPSGAGHHLSTTPHPLARTEHVREQYGRGKRGGSPPTSQLRDMPPSKSAGPLRRSSRLSGSPSKRLSELSTRSKSQLKSPRRSVEGSAKKGVTFSSSVKTRVSGPASSSSSLAISSSSKFFAKSQSSSSSSGGVASMPLPLSPVREGNVLTCNQNAENLQGVEQGMGREGVVSEGRGVENVKKDVAEGEELEKSIQEAIVAQQLLEKAAITGLTSLMQLLVSIGHAYRALTRYDLGEAVRLFQSLPAHHWETPWVLGQVGQAYFAAERFDKAAKIFKQVHSIDPHRQEGMELYSSSLWHLQREVELSVVAHQLRSSDKLRPQGICAMASLKNLQKDNEAAIALLTTATEVSPDFVYAHTLLGHEYWLAKDYEKALSSFQSATGISVRHYNAWYGMAHVSFAQEKYQSAEVYANRAIAINGCSSIAYTQMGLAQFRQSKHAQALKTFDKALAINPLNPIPRFHKAKTLEAMELLEESLQELDILTRSWPKDPNVCISKGKVLKRLNRMSEAVLQFNWALEYGRSGPSNQIREEIDRAYNQNTSELRNDGEVDFQVLSDSQIERMQGAEGFEGVLPGEEDADDDDSMRSGYV